MLEYLKRRAARRKAANDLYGLSARDLRDIGLNRCDIPRILAKM